MAERDAVQASASAPAAATADGALDGAALVQRAWELSYLDLHAAREMGHRLVRLGAPWSASGWLHVALAEVRQGELPHAADALQEARSAFARLDDPNGLAWCDEVQAIALRRSGDYAASSALQAELDHRPGLQRDGLQRFFSHNSRAITAKLLGDTDGALRHFFAATEGAEQCGLAGPRITALCNLGGYHQELFNLDDARRISEEALRAAQAAGAAPALTTAACNLIVIHHAAGDSLRAREMVDFITGHREAMLPDVLTRYALPLAVGHLGVGEIDAALAHLQAGAITAVADGDGVCAWTWLKARCLLARDDAAGARALAEQLLHSRREQHRSDQPFDLMELYRVLADACERTGDAAAALAYLREAQSRYEQLVGRSARARYIALEVSHELAAAQRERDRAVDSHRSSEQDRHRLAELNAALQAQIAQTEQLHAKLREQALNDPLTGLHNRRYLFETAPRLLDLARRESRSVCVVLVDLDHFKLLNDTYGHQAGDRVLQRFATLMRQTLRRSDIVTRHGGEEFVAVMPEIDADAAQVVLARLLEAFQSLAPEPGRRRPGSASFSAGIAVFPRHGSTLEQLLLRADRALYAAKRQGRARIEQAPRTGYGSFT